MCGSLHEGDLFKTSAGPLGDQPPLPRVHHRNTAAITTIARIGSVRASMALCPLPVLVNVAGGHPPAHRQVGLCPVNHPSLAPSQRSGLADLGPHLLRLAHGGRCGSDRGCRGRLEPVDHAHDLLHQVVAGDGRTGDRRGRVLGNGLPVRCPGALPVEPPPGLLEDPRLAPLDLGVDHLAYRDQRAAGGPVGDTTARRGDLVIVPGLAVASQREAHPPPPVIVLASQLRAGVAHQVGHLVGHGLVQDVLVVLVALDEIAVEAQAVELAVGPGTPLAACPPRHPASQVEADLRLDVNTVELLGQGQHLVSAIPHGLETRLVQSRAHVPLGSSFRASNLASERPSGQPRISQQSTKKMGILGPFSGNIPG